MGFIHTLPLSDPHLVYLPIFWISRESIYSDCGVGIGGCSCVREASFWSYFIFLLPASSTNQKALKTWEMREEERKSWPVLLERRVSGMSIPNTKIAWDSLQASSVLRGYAVRSSNLQTKLPHWQKSHIKLIWHCKTSFYCKKCEFWETMTYVVYASDSFFMPWFHQHGQFVPPSTSTTSLAKESAKSAEGLGGRETGPQCKVGPGTLWGTVTQSLTVCVW